MQGKVLRQPLRHVAQCSGGLPNFAGDCVQERFFPYRLKCHLEASRSQSTPAKNEIPADGRDFKHCVERQLGGATLTVAILILIVGLVLTALLGLVLAGLTALLALLLLTGLTAVLALSVLTRL